MQSSPAGSQIIAANIAAPLRGCFAHLANLTNHYVSQLRYEVVCATALRTLVPALPIGLGKCQDPLGDFPVHCNRRSVSGGRVTHQSDGPWPGMDKGMRSFWPPPVPSDSATDQIVIRKLFCYDGSSLTEVLWRAIARALCTPHRRFFRRTCHTWWPRLILRDFIPVRPKLLPVFRILASHPGPDLRDSGMSRRQGCPVVVWPAHIWGPA